MSVHTTKTPKQVQFHPNTTRTHTHTHKHTTYGQSWDKEVMKGGGFPAKEESIRRVIDLIQEHNPGAQILKSQ
jgi:hypothetical protein